MGAIAPTGKRFKLIEEIRQAKQEERRRLDPELAKLIRKRAGVSRRRMAAELGVHTFTIVKWEDGTRRPTGERGRAYYDLLEQLRRVAG